MASEHVSDPEQTKPLEEKIADLNLQEKAGVVTGAAKEYLDGAKDAAHITAEEVKKDFKENAEKASETSDEGHEHSPQDVSSREVQVAKKEVEKSPDDGAYVVPAVDHRTVEDAGGEEKKVDVPTAIVHENADPVDKPQQQGKGLIQSVTGKITTSVKSVFSGFSGSKAEKSGGGQSNGTSQ